MWHSSGYFMMKNFALIQRMLKKSVTIPYAPMFDSASAEAIPKEGASVLSPRQVPTSIPRSSTFGSSSSN